MKKKQKAKNNLAIAISFFVVIIFFLFALPPLTKTALLYGLDQLGATNSKIEDIDINLFNGRFSITGLQIQTDKQPPLNIGKLSVTFHYWSLIKGDIEIDNIALENSQIPVIKKNQEPFYVGVFLESSETKETDITSSPDTDNNKKAWRVLIKQLTVTNTKVQLEMPDVSSIINLQALTLKNFSNHSTEKSQLSARLNYDKTQVKIGEDTFHIYSESPIEWHSQQSITLTGANPSAFLKGKLHLGDVSVNNSMTNPSYKHNNLTLLLSADLQPDPANEALIQASIKSELSLNKPYFSSHFINQPDTEVFKISASNFELQIIQRLTFNKEATPLHNSGTGRLNLLQAKLELKNNQLAYLHDEFAVQWSNKAENIHKQNWKNDLKLQGSVNLKNAEILDTKQNLGLVKLPQLAIQNIKLYGTDHLQIDNIQFDQAHLLYSQAAGEKRNTPFIFSENLSAKNLKLEEFNKLHIGQVRSTGLHAKLNLNKDKQLSLLEPTLTRIQTLDFGGGEINSQKPSQNQENTPQDTPETDTPPSQDSFAWSIADIQLANASLSYTDAHVTPSFSSTLSLDAVNLSPLGNIPESLSSQIILKGGLNSYSKIQAHGSFSVLSPQPSSAIELSVQALELHPFSPYLDQSAGYRIKHGQLNSAIQVRMQNGELDSQAALDLNNLKLEPSSEKARERLSKQLTMPLDVALNTLRDKNKNIRLTIPVQGNISDPNFDFSDIIKQASAKATRAASMSLLKHTLQPYGTMITVAEVAYKGGKKLTAIKLSPINYQAASTELTDEQQDYLGKVATLLKERPGIAITLCGIATTGELPESQADKELLKLASERAEKTKHYLIHNHGIKATRLYSCIPKVDEISKDKRVGRVELHL